MRVKAWKRGDILPYLANFENRGEEAAITWTRDAVQLFGYVYAEIVNTTDEIVYSIGWKDKILS